MVRRATRGGAAAATLFIGAGMATGCAGVTPPAEPVPEDRAEPALPPIPERDGPLRVRVAYPAEGQRLAVRDSNFIFGSVGTGGASLTINDTPVEVAPNGAFLGFVPVPADGVYRLRATAGGEREEATLTVEVPPAADGVGAEVGVVPGSISPTGYVMAREGEPIDVRLRAAAGARARLSIPGGGTVPLVERPATDRAQGFMIERTERVGGISEYVGTFPARAVSGGDSIMIELTRGGETVREPLPLAIETLAPAAVRVATAASARADGTVIGTAIPGSGTPYHWFFPNGTRFTITGARGSQYRVQLGEELAVWVDSSEVRLEPAGVPAPTGTVATVRAVPSEAHIDVRLSTSERLPFQVEPREDGLTVTVYGARSRTNWLQYGAADPLIDRLTWSQPASDVYRVEIDLTQPLWGYDSFFDENGNAVVRVRRPPPIDPTAPFRGLVIALDAGHPPGGAIGPTGLTEAEANLAIVKILAPMLRERGARVLETRPDTAAVGLGDRPLMAADSNAHLLVSVHNNAFGDGVDPWENNGTSVFYNRAQSLGLARELQRAVVAELRLRDLGIARADLALVRPTWMPAALTESMFLMIPEQEAALRDAGVRERIARAHLRGLEAFLLERARAQR